jgi:hypothetical protein
MRRPLGILERIVFGGGAIMVIFSPTGHLVWGAGLVVLVAILTWSLLTASRLSGKNMK